MCFALWVLQSLWIFKFEKVKLCDGRTVTKKQIKADDKICPNQTVEVPNTMAGAFVDVDSSTSMRLFKTQMRYWKKAKESEGFKVVFYGKGKGDGRLEEKAKNRAGYTKKRLVGETGLWQE